MIVLRSQRPNPIRHYFLVAFAVLGVTGAAVVGAVGISELKDARAESDWGAMASVAFQLCLCAVGMAAAGYQLAEQIVLGEPVQRLIATQDTLAIKTRAKPAIFLKRVDCVALVSEGRGLAMADGTKHVLLAYGAERKDVEAFIDALYDDWWPGLARAEVRDYLKAFPPECPKLLMILLGALPVTILLMLGLSFWLNLWLVIGVCMMFVLLSAAFALAAMHLLARTSGQARYPLYDAESNGTAPFPTSDAEYDSLEVRHAED